MVDPHTKSTSNCGSQVWVRLPAGNHLVEQRVLTVGNL